MKLEVYPLRKMCDEYVKLQIMRDGGVISEADQASLYARYYAISVITQAFGLTFDIANGTMSVYDGQNLLFRCVNTVGYEPDIKVKIVCRQLMNVRGIEATAVIDRVTRQDNYLLAILERGIVNDYYMVQGNLSWYPSPTNNGFLVPENGFDSRFFDNQFGVLKDCENKAVKSSLQRLWEYLPDIKGFKLGILVNRSTNRTRIFSISIIK